ncbi:SDR family oxidoreductase [Streptomyces filamentosus]|uniref:SDR family oxidoreductase n=2 Tax=Streptomyces filamentosus TaxID=67294 RepID=A0ABY4V6D1_STRFL|nr:MULTISPECIES: SDR family oxidoreductase [Streptomyces]EFE74448.1 reductase [Streptomyces filamentosus NRRL 15998]ESU50980.1 oxidoreductase [Streptomyces sp. HCCB10043]MYR78588.1 SDR family oxidoreductase [Streptomyces sp. SID5466]USC49791.1 SDR family oxidoreductase [Streptomyces filamentosus]
MGELDGRTALVTGGSRGIGRAVALRLAGEGALVAVHYGGNEAAATETVRLITEAGGRAFAVGALFGGSGAVDLLFEGLATGLKDHGAEGLDILVNNAGVHSIGSIGQLTEEEFARVLAINVSTPVFVVQRALSLLRDGGRIVNIGSAATRIANPVQIGYTVSKAALAALGPSLANELGRRGITVNTVEPGVVQTDLIGDYATVPEAVAALESITALGRMGQPEDVADVVGFLAGPQGRWVTGQTIDASGGTYLGPLIPE